MTKKKQALTNLLLFSHSSLGYFFLSIFFSRIYIICIYLRRDASLARFYPCRIFSLHRVVYLGQIVPFSRHFCSRSCQTPAFIRLLSHDVFLPVYLFVEDIFRCEFIFFFVNKGPYSKGSFNSGYRSKNITILFFRLFISKIYVRFNTSLTG